MIRRLLPPLTKQYYALTEVHKTGAVGLSISPQGQPLFRRTMGGSQSANTEVKFVEKEISDNCVVIFSKTTCGFCRMAKSVFEDIGAPYKAIELNQLQNGRQIQHALTSITGATTVPRVFINGKCIGGGTETKQLQQQGRLLELMSQCGNSSPTSNL